MAEYGDRCQGEIAGSQKAQISGPPKMVIFQDHENRVFSGPPKTADFQDHQKTVYF